MAVHKDGFIENHRISDHFNILFRNHPFAFCKYRFCFDKVFSVFDETRQFTILPVAFGCYRIRQQIKRDRLVSFYPKRVRYPSVGISFEVFHQWSFTVSVLVILEDSPLRRLYLYIFEQSKLFLYFLPLETAGRIFIRICIFQRVLIIQQLFGDLNFFRSNLFDDRFCHSFRNCILCQRIDLQSFIRRFLSCT